DLVACDSDFDLDLWQEVHGVFGAAIDFSVALLTAVSLDLGDGQPVHASRSQGIADLIELERLDNGHDDFHGSIPAWSPRPQLVEGTELQRSRELLHACAAASGNQTPCQSLDGVVKFLLNLQFLVVSQLDTGFLGRVDRNSANRLVRY